MANSIDMNFIRHLYEIAKSDLYTLLIKGSKDELDYIGDVTFFGPMVDLEYRRVNRSSLDSIGLLLVCQNTIDKLLKNDMQMWGATNRISKFYGFSPNSITNKFELSLSLKKEVPESK